MDPVILGIILILAVFVTMAGVSAYLLTLKPAPPLPAAPSQPQRPSSSQPQRPIPTQPTPSQPPSRPIPTQPTPLHPQAPLPPAVTAAPQSLLQAPLPPAVSKPPSVTCSSGASSNKPACNQSRCKPIRPFKHKYRRRCDAVFRCSHSEI